MMNNLFIFHLVAEIQLMRGRNREVEIQTLN